MTRIASILAAAALIIVPTVATAQTERVDTPVVRSRVITIVADNSRICAGRIGENKARQNLRRAKADVDAINASGGQARLVELRPGLAIAGFTGDRENSLRPVAPVYRLTC